VKEKLRHALVHIEHMSKVDQDRHTTLAEEEGLEASVLVTPTSMALRKVQTPKPMNGKRIVSYVNRKEKGKK
jgi:hypothetical protein